jgi:hypothetical protein
MNVRMILYIGLAVSASGGAAVLYNHRDAPLTCDSEQALNLVSEVLRDEYHLDSTLINGIRTVSGGFFSHSHQCSAEVTQIRGNVNASDMPWRKVRYQIVRREKSVDSGITVSLGGAVPLAEPPPSLWTRLLAYL